jgi:hypothetical protein
MISLRGKQFVKTIPTGVRCHILQLKSHMDFSPLDMKSLQSFTTANISIYSHKQYKFQTNLATHPLTNSVHFLCKQFK